MKRNSEFWHCLSSRVSRDDIYTIYIFYILVHGGIAMVWVSSVLRNGFMGYVE